MLGRPVFPVSTLVGQERLKKGSSSPRSTHAFGTRNLEQAITETERVFEPGLLAAGAIRDAIRPRREISVIH